WFVGLDREGSASADLKSQISNLKSPRSTALAAIGGVQWVPAWGEARIRGAVEARPDWCISRQRSWGVPIIAFYDADKNAYIDAGVIRAVADKIAAHPHGSNLWYELSAAELLDGVTLPAGWPAASALTCGRDTLDV